MSMLSRKRKIAMMMPSPTATSAAATAITKMTIICPASMLEAASGVFAATFEAN